MSGFRRRVTRVKGLSDRRRMPLLGKIRLGIKKKAASGAEYPAETEYFVCPDEVKAVYGDEPKVLPIMIPINDVDAVFPVAYQCYGSGKGLKCEGDGETGHFVNDSGDVEKRECPCPLSQGDRPSCKQVGRLLFFIPNVSVAGVYQVSTGSFNSIIDIQSGLEFVEATVGRFAMVGLELSREPTETHHDGMKQTHYTIRLRLPMSMNADDLARLQAAPKAVTAQEPYQLPAPDDSNPELDPVDVLVDEEDTVAPVAEDTPPFDDGPPPLSETPPPPGEDPNDWYKDTTPPREPAPGADVTEPMTEQQRKYMAVLFRKLGVEQTTEARVKKINDWIDSRGIGESHVASSKELSKSKASAFIDSLSIELDERGLS